MIADILRLPEAAVMAAHQALRGQPAASKAEAAKWLDSQGVRPDAIRAYGAAVNRAQAAGPAIDEAKVAQTITAQVETRITETLSQAEARVLSRLDTAERGLTAVADGVARTAADLKARVDAIRVDQSAIDATVAAQVAQAFRPFAQAVKSASAESAVGALVQAQVIARVPVLQAFGIDLKDRKGNPVMVDIWDHADAPQVDPTYIWTEALLRALLLGDGKVWLGGPKGTGKTEAARQFAARTGRAFTRFNFRKFTTAEDYIGATGLDAGSTGFKPGPVLVGLTTPGTVVLLDELTNIDPGEAAPLNGLLEPAGTVSLGGRAWSVAPGVLVIAADNTLGNGDDSGRYAGTRQMNSSLLDRFPVVVRMDYLPRDMEVQALVSHTQCAPALAGHVVDAIRVCRAKVDTGDIVDAPSIRSAIGFIKALALMPVPEAWAVTVANRQPSEGAAALEAVFTASIDQSLIDSLI